MFSDNEIKEIHDNIAKYSIKDSSFEEASSLTGEEKLTIVQNNTSKSFKVSNLISYLNTHESIYHKVEINVVDSDTNKAVNATVKINRNVSNLAYILENTRVCIVISAEGYKTISDAFILTRDESKTYKLKKIASYTLKVKAVPSDANITINGIKQSSITSNEDTTLNISVTRDDFDTKTFSTNLTSNTLANVTLESLNNKKLYTFRLKIDNTSIPVYNLNLKVKINGVEYTRENSEWYSILILPENTEIKYSIQSDFSNTVEGNLILNKDIDEIVILKNKYTFNTTISTYELINNLPTKGGTYSLIFYYGVPSANDYIDISSSPLIDVTNTVDFKFTNNNNKWLFWNKETGILTVNPNYTNSQRKETDVVCKASFIYKNQEVEPSLIINFKQLE